MPETPRAPRTRDSEAAKARLLQAATEEFAAYGIAGARIDRIGAAAKVNKAQIYTYFGNKDQLFDIVMDLHVTRVLDDVPFTPGDLPDYAGKLFDYLIANPHQLRLATWNRLERTDGGPGPVRLAASMEQKTAAIAQAQADGSVPGAFGAEDLLTFVLALAGAWTPTSAMAPGGWTRRCCARIAERLSKPYGVWCPTYRRLVSRMDVWPPVWTYGRRAPRVSRSSPHRSSRRHPRSGQQAPAPRPSRPPRPSTGASPCRRGRPGRTPERRTPPSGGSFRTCRRRSGSGTHSEACGTG